MNLITNTHKPIIHGDLTILIANMALCYSNKKPQRKSGDRVIKGSIPTLSQKAENATHSRGPLVLLRDYWGATMKSTIEATPVGSEKKYCLFESEKNIGNKKKTRPGLSLDLPLPPGWSESRRLHEKVCFHPTI